MKAKEILTTSYTTYRFQTYADKEKGRDTFLIWKFNKEVLLTVQERRFNFDSISVFLLLPTQ